jgi:ketosteroid isomerase-like protein
MKLAPLLVITLLAVPAAPCAHAQEKSADSSAITAKLKQMENDWAKALQNKDHAAVGNMVANDFAGFNSKGKHRTKSQLVDEIKNETDTLSSSENDSMDVHVYAPNLATVCGTSTEKGRRDGKAFTHSYAWVDTWMERNGKWECIAEAVMQFPEKK